jgi:GT2 family glycosyltransferase
MTILMYHKVSLDSPTMWWVSVNSFYRQMLELQGKKVVYLDDYDPTDTEQFVITFDGVYKNVLDYAAPILKEFNYPFELFVTSDYLGRDNSFDCPEPPAEFANLQELECLVKINGRLQWHTRSHPDLTDDNQKVDLSLELEVPEKLRKIDPQGYKWFAYPYGKFNERVIEKVKDKFYGALSCIQGNDTYLYCLNRITVTNETSFKNATLAVIIASYNYGNFLVEAIESVLRQTRLPDEILITDDASSDDTYEIAQYYQDKYPDLIKININEANLGIVNHFNKAVGLTTSDYITFLGADNRYRSDFLEQTSRILDTHPDVAIAYTDFALFGQRAKLVYDAFPEHRRGAIKANKFFIINFPNFNEDSRQELLTVGNFMHGSSMFRRKAFDAVGGYLKKPNTPEDYDLFRRIVKAGWNAKRSPYPLLEYRQHSKNQTQVQLASFAELQFYRNLAAETQVKNQKFQSNLQQMQAVVEHSQSQLQQTQSQLQQTQSQLQQTQAGLEYAQFELQQTQANLEHSQLELQQTQANLEHSQLELQQTQRQLLQSQSQFQQMQTALEHFQFQLQHAQTEMKHLKERITAMESSKFWKLRKGWFKLKRLLGIKDNE